MISGVNQLGGLKNDSGVGETSRVSKARRANSDGKTTQSENKSKYITVVEGKYAYTYVVIGDKFKVLIGKVAIEEEEKEQKDASSNEAGKDGGVAGAARQEKANEADKRNAPYQNSQDFLACRQLLAAAKREGFLPE